VTQHAVTPCLLEADVRRTESLLQIQTLIRIGCAASPFPAHIAKVCLSPVSELRVLMQGDAMPCVHKGDYQECDWVAVDVGGDYDGYQEAGEAAALAWQLFFFAEQRQAPPKRSGCMLMYLCGCA
jgi:hypothetical protein